MKPKAISYSQITTYQQCALKYHYKYRTNIKGKRDEDISPALANGIKVHKAIELWINGEDKVYIDMRLNKEQKAMFENWITHCLPSLTIGTANILTETKLTGNWHGWPLLGYLDMLWFEDEGATAYICDVKTGNNLFYLPEKMWYSLQPDIYAALVRLNYPDVEDVYWRTRNRRRCSKTGSLIVFLH